VVEPREAGQFQAALEDYRAKLDAGGAVLFAVCRGKVGGGEQQGGWAGRGAWLEEGVGGKGEKGRAVYHVQCKGGVVPGGWVGAPAT
jgi:hypothetical protein